MRNLLIIVLIFYVSSCLVSKTNKHKEGKIVLSIQNSSCKGNCLIYKLTFYSNGKGVFNDIKNKREDRFKYSTNDLDKIIIYSEQIKFSEIGNKYYNIGLQDIQVKTIII